MQKASPIQPGRQKQLATLRTNDRTGLSAVQTYVVARSLSPPFFPFPKPSLALPTRDTSLDQQRGKRFTESVPEFFDINNNAMFSYRAGEDLDSTVAPFPPDLTLFAKPRAIEH